MDDLISSEDLETCLRVLRRAVDLDPTDSKVRAIEQAAAGLRKRAKKARRAERAKARQAHDAALLAQTTLHQSQKTPDVDAPLLGGALHAPRRCYACKQGYVQVHARYHAMCPTCGACNEARRAQRADLTRRVALVTGGRIKIGFATALKLLRDGATVHVSTRFPEDARARYAALPDVEQWKTRLHIHGVDFRDIRGVQAFAAQLAARGPLDILVHNAAQTVRRPDAFYRTLARAELAGHTPSSNITALEYAPERAAAYQAWLRQCVQQTDDEGWFPEGALSINGEPLDLREETSWRMTLEEVPAGELMEVWVINAFVPYVLNATLKPALLASPFSDRYVVHVTATEGQFSWAHKSEHHPHLNMGKAALNMLTRTSAQAWAKQGIYMTAVDTGWVSDGGTEASRRAHHARGWKPPLDAIDAAARIYDPIVQGVTQARYLHGVLLKDYREVPW